VLAYSTLTASARLIYSPTGVRYSTSSTSKFDQRRIIRQLRWRQPGNYTPTANQQRIRFVPNAGDWVGIDPEEIPLLINYLAEIINEPRQLADHIRLPPTSQ
jgi:hypothetical protein